MKKVLKNKKMIFTAIVILLLIIAGVVIILFSNKEKKEEKILKEEINIAYVKINPLVKLTFNTKYYECTYEDGKTDICGNHISEITNVELVNEDAKEIYKQLDLKGESLEDAIELLISTASVNEIEVKDVQITVNFKYANKIKENIKTESEINITIDYQKEIDEQKILETEKDQTYEVKFNSNGGSSVAPQIIKENEETQAPKTPTKKGYKFIEWQLDGKKYDFEEKVTKNIILTAKWEKEATETTKDNSNNNQEIPTTTSCTPKKFNNKYSYFYTTEEECVKQGNRVFLDVSDNIDSSIFTYGCEQIVDDCKDIYYGIYFNVWNGEEVVRVYY